MRTATIVTAVFVTVALAPAALAGGSGGGEPVPDHGRLIVGFEEPEPRLEEGDRLDGYPVIFAAPDGAFVVVRVEDRDALPDLREEPGVAYVEFDHRGRSAAFTPNDPGWDEQYAPQQVDLPQAWEHVTGGSEVPVCVGDTGVRYTHEDINGSRWKGGYDYAQGDADPWDNNGHGTHTTSIAAAWLDNDVGVAGTGNVPFYQMKVLRGDGFGWYSWWAAGIRNCMDEGDVVVSLSLGGEEPSTTLKSAVEDAWADGDLVVAAAHNDGPCSDCIRYPAAYSEVVAVTCTDSDEQLCGFSSTGPGAELAAPGSRVLGAWNDGDSSYAYAWGTSMSTPRIAGAAALLWSRTPTLTNDRVRRLLNRNAEDLGPQGRDNKFGYGELDVDDALPPTVPRNFEATASGLGAVLLSWDPPADAGAGPVQTYRVFRGHPGDPLQLVATTTRTTYLDEGPHLLQPQQYRYTVQPVNEAGAGPTPPAVCEGGGPWGSVDGPSKRVCEEGRDRRPPVSFHPFTDTAGEGNVAAVSGTGHAEGLVAASAAGDADSNGGVAVSGTGDASGLVPVSARGNCSSGDGPGQPCWDAGTGDVEAHYVAVGAESASCPRPFACVAVAGIGPADGPVAVSGLGEATGAAAASGTGDAEALVAASGTGDAAGIVAASGTGRADGVFLEVSGCEEASLLCRDAPTRDVRPQPSSPRAGVLP